MDTDKLLEQANICLEQRVDVPSAPLWHMGKIAKFQSKQSLDLMQNTIDYLTCKGIAGMTFTADEKIFMKELFEAMWWGGKYLGYPEAAKLASHYVNGKGHSIQINAEVYKESTIVTDVANVMKDFVRSLEANKNEFEQLNSNSPKFISNPISTPLKRGRRNANNHGYLLPEGVLLTEQKNKRLKNADHRFVLEMTSKKIQGGFRTKWAVNSIYDFEPFTKGDITHLELGTGMTLKLPDGLSHYLTTIGVADAFRHSSQWEEEWS